MAERHGVPTNGIVLGNGSTEILQMGVQARLDPQLRLVAPTPTFEDVFEYSEPHPWIDLKPIPLLPDYAHDLTGMEEATRGASGPVLVYVCNPNNPTGSLTSVADVESWIRRAPENVHFLVDEAYFEFVDSGAYRSLDKLAFENPNVVVARTFSKVYGMAGMRLGYADRPSGDGPDSPGLRRGDQLQPPGSGGGPGCPGRRGVGGKERRREPEKPANSL